MSHSALIRHTEGALDRPAPAEARDVVAAWLVGYRGNTRAAYGRDMRDFLAWCAGRGLELLTVGRPHVELYARELEERRGLSPATIARRLSTLSSFYRYAVDELAVARSPVRGRRPRVSDESSTLGLTQPELVALLQRATLAGPTTESLVCLLGLNGLRVSEALGADVEDLDWERGHRVVRVTRKGGKRVVIPLAERTAAAVDRLVSDHRTGPLFRGARGGRLSRGNAHRVIVELSRSAGVRKRIHPHSLRHTFATLALDAGVPLRDLQVAMSHADPRTTARYDRARRGLDNAPTYRLAASLPLD